METIIVAIILWPILFLTKSGSLFLKKFLEVVLIYENLTVTFKGLVGPAMDQWFILECLDPFRNMAALAIFLAHFADNYCRIS
jgi:hypothetical protein